MSSKDPHSALDLLDDPEIAADYQLELSVARAIEFARRSRLTSASGAGASAYLGFLIWGDVDHKSIIIWWVTLLVVDMVSVLHATRGLRWLSLVGRARSLDLQDRLRRFRRLQFLLHDIAGLLWGSTAIWAVQGVDQAQRLSLVGIVLMAVATVGSIGLMHYRSAVTGFNACVWAIPLVVMLSKDDPELVKLGVGIVVLLISLNFYLWEASAQLKSGLERRIRSDHLRDLVQLKATEIEKLASFDELTGCMTRRAGMERIREQMNASSDESTQSALVLVDVDWFKSVNDNYGHLAGDAVLRQVAERIRLAVREQDIVVRFGGEEFLIALVGVDPDAALALTNRVRCAVAGEPVVFAGGEVSCTISAGVGPVTNADDIDAALVDVDIALYEAKNQGRNRAVAVGQSQ